MLSNSTIKFYKNSNIELSGNFLTPTNSQFKNKIFLTTKTHNSNNISLTQYNLNNNISKENHKIFFKKSFKKKINKINTGFHVSNVTLPDSSNYLFNSNEISNNSTAILNYKLYELRRGYTSISQLDLGDISNGLLKNFSNIDDISSITWIPNNYINVSYDNTPSNIINNINYYRPASISFEIIHSDSAINHLYLTYAFKENNDNIDPSFYLIQTPRDFRLQQTPIDRNIYQLRSDRIPLDYDFLTPEYEIFSEELNLNSYLENNEYILHYNNKIIPIQNIDLIYDEDRNEFIVKSLNRFFIGEVTGQFKLKFFNDIPIYNFESTELDVKFNIICNPNLCPLPALHDRRQMSYRIGSMASFRMQFSRNIKNAHKSKSRKTIFISQ